MIQSTSENDKLFDNFIGKNEWLTTDKAAHLLSISPNALRIMVHRGQIQVYKFGRRLRFKICDCLALIQKKGAEHGN
jgi:excisionase family DNA binding protein